jgi:hypothetical protein
MSNRIAIAFCALVVGCGDPVLHEGQDPDATPSPGSLQALFQSDWRTQSGNLEVALSDGGKWNSMSAGASSNASVIDAPAGFPMHKALRVASDGTRDGWVTPTITTLGTIPIGTSRNYRWYHALHEPALTDYGQHPIQDGGAVSQSNWFFSTHNRAANGDFNGAIEWGLDYQFEGNTNFNDSRYTLGTSDAQHTPLRKGVLYRHEIQVVRISATQFRFHAWVYDAAGNLLYDDEDFRNRNGSGSLATAVHTFQDVSNTGIFLIGLNGIGNSPAWPIHSSDQGGIAIVQGLPERQPIGAYGSVAGETPR